MSQDLDDLLLLETGAPDATGVGAADAAEAVLDQAELVRRPDRFLGAVLDGMGAEGLLERHPARIFDALALGRDDGEAERLHALFEVVALPGQTPAGRLRPGDVLIRRADGGRGHAAVLAQGELQTPDGLEAVGLYGEAAAGGGYAPVVEPGARTRTQARRVLDGAGRAPFDQMILRLRGGAADAFAEGDINNREYVRWIQTSLNRITGSTLTVDGLYGPQTRTAVRAFQQSKGLTVDGIVGPKTDAALRGGPGGETLTPSLPQKCIGLPERQTIDNFEFGKADILPRHQPQIINAAFCIRDSHRSKTPIRTLTIIGHTDPVGDAAANEALGRRRAEAIRDQILKTLERIGSNAKVAVTIETKGEREPIPGDPGMSRRVEVVAPFAFPLAKPVPPPKPKPPVPPAPTSVLDPPRWKPIISRAISANAVLRAGNNVRHLIDGEHPTPALGTYAAMVDDINAARGPGSYIYLLGWAMVDDFEMMPCRPNTTARALFATAAGAPVGRRAQIRAMLWKQAPAFGLRKETDASAKNINDLHAVAGLDAAAIVDNETLNLGSHHQKVLVINGEKGLVAYVGGVDINHDRINRCPTGPAPAPGGGGGGSGPSGPGSSPTPASPAHGMPPSAPLHDVHCRIDGPAAFDLLTTFIRRWDHHPDHVAIDTRRALIGRGVTAPPAKTSSPASQSSTGATCSVAIARTFNPVTRGTTVPRERDIRGLLLAAIGAAKRFIYMEDQYMISLDAARALNAAVPRLQHVTILIGATQNVSDLPCVWTFRRNFMEALTAGLTAQDLDKVRVFRLASPPNPSPLPACGAATPGFTPRFGEHTYVHTKSWFFDDEMAVIGTANCNRRGWEHDSEVNAFIFDDARPSGSARTFCQQTRMDLWAEHLNAPASRFADGVASARDWLAPPAGHRVLRYCPNEGNDAAPSLCNSMREAIDPGQP